MQVRGSCRAAGGCVELYRSWGVRMPTYEYACEACGNAFEEFQAITAAPLKKCPQCSKPKLKRLIGTGGGVIFKGSGFYTTDYRSESYKKAAEAAKSSESGKPAESGTAKSDTKSESTKPAATEPKAEKTAPAAGSAAPAATAKPKSTQK